MVRASSLPFVLTATGMFFGALPASAQSFVQLSMAGLRSDDPDFTRISTTCSTPVCSLVTPTDTVVPFPMLGSFEVDSTGGRVRGKARIENVIGSAGGFQFGIASGVISYETRGRATFITSSVDPLLIELGMAGLPTTTVLSAHNHEINSSQTGSLTANISSLTTISLRGAQSGVRRFDGTTGGGLQSSSAEINDDLSVTDDFSTEFTIGVTRKISLDMHRDSVFAESDFQHTFEFTSLLFYDNAGRDVTRYLNVTFDDPEFYMRSLSVAAIPEPETYAMMLAGLGLLGVLARRRRQKVVVGYT